MYVSPCHDFLKNQNYSLSCPEEKSTTSPTRTFMTPKKPWSFFLNFFWSNICTANILSSEARLSPISICVSHPRGSFSHRSKCSFQYGFKVLLITEVVFVCSPPNVATAKGSGKPRYRHQYVSKSSSRTCIRNTSRLYNPSAAITIQN